SGAEGLDWRERSAALAEGAPAPTGELVTLPAPSATAGRAVGETIQARGSTREFSGAPIARAALSAALAHGARGVAADIPSGLVDLYLAVHAVEGVAP